MTQTMMISSCERQRAVLRLRSDYVHVFERRAVFSAIGTRKGGWRRSLLAAAVRLADHGGAA